MGSFLHLFLALLVLSIELRVRMVGAQSCSSVRKRKEWRTLDRASQISYIKAVKCLGTKPSRLSTEFQLRRYDDFQYVHASLQGEIHFVAQFLPWHRHFIYIYEKELHKCGYSGSLPRWNWALDARNVTAGPVWSSDRQVTGFGTNGTGPHNSNLEIAGGRVMDGAFREFELRHPQTHFLERAWTIFLDSSINGSIFGSQYFDNNAIRNILRLRTFSDFWVAVEGENPDIVQDASPGPHAMVHALVGAEFSTPAYSANDTDIMLNLNRFNSLFFLHHANIDWLWWRWQHANPKRQMMAYEGNTRQGRTWPDASLDDTLEFIGLDGSNPLVRDTMDASKFPYCYACAPISLYDLESLESI
ncbi:hypothetical protein CROQUDRAFT_49975 [Cronartium quercuum f. sp. fusiforme G11]|uniref:Tyrosinase copper-binding domain-containing protein n=1 Tax=Cronartium quercuum f. sp. fusiforme G11 TaxID=708437 RepID=A0A9P6NEH9_9BASI|nr:hypothetical protein CROQUDRAFT_49975 [Cronartium quercuum f. sp. fusiforme G11]